MPRRKVPAAVQDRILSECRRRCALCFALNNDVSAKVHGQLAHIDRNPGNSRPENLAYLCLEHANLYDTVSKQSKGITPGELKRYKKGLLVLLKAAHDVRRIHRVIAAASRELAVELARERLAEKRMRQSPPSGNS